MYFKIFLSTRKNVDYIYKYSITITKTTIFNFFFTPLL